MAIEYRRILKLVDTSKIPGGANFIYIVELPKNEKNNESKMVYFRCDMLGKPGKTVDPDADTRLDVQVNIVDGGVSGSRSQVALLDPGQKGYFDSLTCIPGWNTDINSQSRGFLVGITDKSYFVSRAPIMPLKPYLQVGVPESAANSIKLRIEIVVRIEAISELESVQALYSGGPIV